MVIKQTKGWRQLFAGSAWASITSWYYQDNSWHLGSTQTCMLSCLVFTLLCYIPSGIIVTYFCEAIQFQAHEQNLLQLCYYNSVWKSWLEQLVFCSVILKCHCIFFLSAWIYKTLPEFIRHLKSKKSSWLYLWKACQFVPFLLGGWCCLQNPPRSWILYNLIWGTDTY